MKFNLQTFLGWSAAMASAATVHVIGATAAIATLESAGKILEASVFVGGLAGGAMMAVRDYRKKRAEAERIRQERASIIPVGCPVAIDLRHDLKEAIRDELSEPIRRLEDLMGRFFNRLDTHERGILQTLQAADDAKEAALEAKEQARVVAELTEKRDVKQSGRLREVEGILKRLPKRKGDKAEGEAGETTPRDPSSKPPKKDGAE